ncbi:MAG: hypothetical protein CVU80_02330 [Elusimicrobia bacterium HGW-Elusimicrobia-4]|nr:MAG: hypothetical protein CVU80_02330 [Elusimicrobia bacterium HGW-Elusimicrobia-4]
MVAPRLKGWKNKTIFFLDFSVYFLYRKSEKMRLFNLTKNKVVVESVIIAESYLQRTKGLLGRENIDENEGLLIKNCNWIHMFFMKFPIDAIFLRTQKCHSERSEESQDASLLFSMTDDTNRIIYKVVKIKENIKPWRLSSLVWSADSVLEIKAGMQNTKNIFSVGDELEIMEKK